ncbi:primase-helicase family protein [Phaeodactylibacter xiamenensis]|uniref:primase-helicase family protein n=1 Tax=Phaeodactylibacter xiamenensis TaxID=1524460 RepID=UPI003CCBDA99
MTKIPENKTVSNDTTQFYHKQLQELGLTGPEDPNNYFEVTNVEIEPPAPQTRKIQIFAPHSRGMKINYWNLRGEQITQYTDQKNPKPVNYSQIRIADPEAPHKYIFRKGFSAYPFFPPEIIQPYRAGDQIPVLFLTEGAKKAFYASKRGMPTVGVTSPHTLKDRETGRLHHDIEELIRECKVEHIVLLMDADCWNISEKALAAGEDISMRPAGFYSAAKKLRDFIADIPELENRPKVHYYAVDAKDLGSPKGLDDAMRAAEQAGCLEDLVEEALTVSSRSNRCFFKQEISSKAALTKLRKAFTLHKAEEFYERHKDIIQGKIFRFQGDTYQFDEEKGELEIKRPGYMDKIYVIGNDFFEKNPKVKTRETGNGNSEVYTQEELSVRSKTILNIKYEGFLKYLRPELDIFDGFCCVPDNINYQERVHGNYNKYSPPPYHPEPGNCETIINFIQHIFGEEEVTHKNKTYKMWELGLDYLNILYKKPTQALPILVLYSPENNTGKSTFAKLLFEMFGDNVLDISNNDLRSEFNEQFAGKILAICEETLMDKKEDADKLKAWSTKTKMSINPKGSARYPIDFYCKFQLYSNNKKMVYVTKEDDRYWMLQVHPPKRKDPNLFVKMRDEIPAFMDYLLNREPLAPFENRMYFHPNLYRTALFEEVAALNTPSDGRHLEEELRAIFALLNEKDTTKESGYKYIPTSLWRNWARKNQELAEKMGVDVKKSEEILPAPNNAIYMSLGDINDEFFNGKLAKNRLKDILEQMGIEKWEDGKKVKAGKYPVIEKPVTGDDDDEVEMGNWLRWKSYNNRVYVFHRDRFLND